MENNYFTIQTTDQTSKLKQLIRPVKEVVSEGILIVREDEVEMKAADPAMVGLIHFKIKGEYFDKLELHKDEEVKAGINFENFYKFLKKATNEDKLTIQYGEGEEKELWIVQNEMEEGFRIRKGFKKLNLSEDDIPTVGDLEHTNEFEVETDKLKAVLEHFTKFHDSVTWTASEDGLKMKAKGDNGNSEAFLSTDQQHIRYAEFDEEVKSMFSMDYLETHLTGKTLPSLADKVDIAMGTDFPVKITHEDENFVYKFVLAPRIEDEN